MMRKCFNVFAALILLGALLSSAVCAGYIDGYIKDQNGNPIQGANVVQYVDPEPGGTMNSVYSDANGYYKVYNQNGGGFYVYKDGYTMPVRWQEDGFGTYDTQDWVLADIPNQPAVTDSFNSGVFAGRTTEDPGAYGWAEKGSGATVADGKLTVNSGNIAAIQTAPGNFDMQARFRDTGTGLNAIVYRLTPGVGGAVQDYNAGETVFFQPGGNIYGGAYNYSPWDRQYVTTGGIDFSVWHTVRIRAVGYKFQLWMDGTLLVDKMNIVEPNQTYDTQVRYDGYPYPSYPGAPDYLNAQVYTGYIGFASFGDSNMELDWVNVVEGTHAVPEPSSIVTLLGGIVGLFGFARRRRA